MYAPPDLEAVLKHSALVVIVFDSTNPESFQSVLDNYLPTIQSMLPDLQQECILVIENKIDERQRIEAKKMKVSPALRRLNEAQKKQQHTDPQTSATAAADDDVNHELVDLRAAHGELFAQYPNVSYVDMCPFNHEKVEFLLTGMIDILITAFVDQQQQLQQRKDRATKPVQEKPKQQAESGSRASTTSPTPPLAPVIAKDTKSDTSRPQPDARKVNDITDNNKQATTDAVVHPRLAPASNRTTASSDQRPSTNIREDDDEASNTTSSTSDDDSDDSDDSDKQRKKKQRQKEKKEKEKQKKKKEGKNKKDGGTCGCRTKGGCCNMM